jgi:hypothetical protein
MTILKNKNGGWSWNKIGGVSAVVMAACAAFAVIPQAVTYTKAGLAPWTSLPEEVRQSHKAEMQAIQLLREDLSDLARRQGYRLPSHAYEQPTNNYSYEH